MRAKAKVQARQRKAVLKDTTEDLRMQETIKRRAGFSLGLLGKAIGKNGSGQFINIRSTVSIH